MDDQRGRGAGMTGPGFVFVRGFLWWMLAIFAALGGMAAFLSWYFAMDLSINARGQLRPAARHGTSASQGKFTLQLNLRRQLQALGFAVGQLGTEPHAELFGMDACFPCGYASPLRIPYQYYPAYLDAQMRAINAKKPDIILVGSQSGTIPYDIHHPRTHSLGSRAFLMGTRPDACVLVVNSIDADDYIRDTLDALRGVAKTRVLALAMSDKTKHPREIMGRTLHVPRQMDDAEIAAKLAQLEERFGLPAVSILDEQGQERLVELIVNYFGTAQEEDEAWTKQSA